MRKKSYGIIAMCMASVLLSGCQKEEDLTQESQLVNVETISPSYDTITAEGTFVGTVETEDVVSIFPKITAQVISKYYEVGDYVNAGDVLFVLDDKALQIEKRNADASVQSAAAALDAQKANNTATQAAANEALGTIATTEYERAKAVNEADREANAARANESKYWQQADLSKGDANRAKEQIDKANDQLLNAQNYYNYLNSIKNEYTNKYKEVYEDPSDSEDAKEAGEYYLTTKTAFTNYEELSAALEATKGVIDTAATEKTAQEGNYSSSMIQKIEACTNAEIEKGTVANAQEAKLLAQKMFADYELFTKNTIIAETNARVAEGQANVAASDSLLESAKAAQDLASLQLSYTNVTAPISGIINEINIEQYGMASDQNAAYVITGQNTKKICFGVPEITKERIEIGQLVTIQKDDKEYSAVVTRINDNLKQGATLFRIEAAIQDCEETEFVVGSKLKLKTSVQKQENVMTVPISSLYYDDGKPYLFVAENGKAIRKDVEVGISDEYKIQIISGLDDSSQVITSWSSSLKDKTDISIVASNNSENIDVTVKTVETEKNQPDRIDISRKSNSDTQDNTEVAVIMVETTDTVNIRKEPSTDGEKLGKENKGAKFEKIADTDNGWTKINYYSQEAYIKSDYIKVVQ